MIEVELTINQYNTKSYYIKGTHTLHREDGPAWEYTSGTKWWYQHGKCHRLDGPACECYDGRKFWYLDGKEINCTSQQEFENSVEFRSFKLKAFW